jgi:uncharacterized protein YjbI with pentapeptide repeats
MRSRLLHLSLAVVGATLLLDAGYHASHTIALDRLLLWVVPPAFLVAVALIYFVPRHLIPDGISSRREDIVATIQARNELRKTGAQLLAGTSFVLTFLLSIYNFNRDFTQRAKQSAADEFSKAIAQVSDARGSSTLGAFYLLAQIAQDDPAYHEAAFKTMADYIVREADRGCVDRKDGQTRYRDQTTKFEPSPQVQLIASVFANRTTENDDSWHTFNLAGACLSRVNWLDVRGGVHLLMSGARLFRVDMRNAVLRGSFLQDAVAGVDLLDELKDRKPKTSDEIESLWDDGKTIYRANFEGADLSLTSANGADFRGATFARANLEDANWKDVRLEAANMKGATLVGTDLSRAHLAGADLSGAQLDFSHLAHVNFNAVKLENASLLYTNLAHANLTEAIGLTPDQLRKGCVYAENEPLELAQPLLPPLLAESLRGSGGLPSCGGWGYDFWRRFARFKALLTDDLSSSF